MNGRGNGLFGGDELCWLPCGAPQWLLPGVGEVGGSTAAGPPDLLPVLLSGLLDLSFEE